MAGRIAGITIEIGGDTTKLQSALKGVDRQLRSTQSALKDINKLLKLDPGNTELLRQKQKQLAESINLTKQRLQELKAAQSQVAEGTPEWDALQREIIATEQELKRLEKEYRQFGSVAAQQIKAAGEKMKDFGNKVTNVGQKLMPLSRTAAAIGAGLLGLGYKAVTTADDLNTLSQQTGLTTEEIQKMQYASDLVDVSFEDMAGGLKKLKKSMTGHADTWEQLGISVTNADGTMRNATDVFYETLGALSQIENETERDQVAMDLFGKSADQLAGIIDDGGAALKQYGEEAKNLGLIMDQDTLDSLNELNDTIDKLKANFKGSFAKLGASIATAFGPAMEKVSGILETVAEKIRNLTPEQAALIAKIVGIVAAVGPLLVIGGKLITGIGMLLTFAPMIALVFNPVSLAIAGVVAAIAGLVAAGVWLVKNWDTIKAKAAAFKDEVVAGWQATKAEAAASWAAITTTISTAVTNAKTTAVNIFNSLKSSVLSIVNGMKASLSSAWNSMKTTAINAFNGLKSGITNVLESIKSKAQSIVDSIKSIFSFNISLPSISGGGGITKYASAYHNPVVFTQPTVLATPSGYKQFGDGNGAEVVMGLNKLRELVSSTSGGGVIINVYPSQGMDVNQLADQIQDRFIQLQKQRSLAYA